MQLRQVILACAGLAVVLLSLGLQAEDATTAGTIKTTETHLGLLLTGDWGRGMLTFNGENHMYHMGGGKIGNSSVAKMTVIGTVYYLILDVENLLEKNSAFYIGCCPGSQWSYRCAGTG